MDKLEFIINLFDVIIWFIVAGLLFYNLLCNCYKHYLIVISLIFVSIVIKIRRMIINRSVRWKIEINLFVLF